jgi:WD40 repeat protein/tRNA A-37 threonylcarbamoyl transferase component Bud32
MVPSDIYCTTCGAANQVQDAFCFACGRPLQASASSLQYPVAGSVSSTLTGLLTSNHLLKNRYRIIDLLGQGGMGAVYKAEDTRFHNQLVAVKEMSQSHLSQQQLTEAVGAFQREVHMLANLDHQSLPKMHDSFHNAGRWYLVMDFITGETLEDYMSKKGGKLPPQEVLGIGIQLCTVLDYLHTRQPPIIFRDLKPGNVMRTCDGHLYLIDFGIARHFKPGQTSDTMPLGSPGYAAPEQYARVQAQTTPRTDMYGLGATLHQLLSGDDPSQTPFKFAPLGTRVQAIPTGLETLIMRMVEMDADKRPARIAAVKQELQAIASPVAPKQTSSLQPITPPKRVAESRQVLAPSQRQGGKPSARKRGPSRRAVLLGGLGTLAIVAAGGAGWWLYSTHPLYAYRGHASGVTAVAWSPNGKRIASASFDKTIQVWDATTGGNVYTYRGHADGVIAVAWSPDGKRIASAGFDKTIQVWDATTGGNVYTYRMHASAVYAVAWSPDGKRIASASDDKTVQVWDVTTGGNAYTYNGHASSVYAVAWSPDGKRIASAGFDKTIQVWDATTGGNIYTYRMHASAVYAVAWSPNGKHIASASGDETVRVWNATNGGNIYTYHGHAGRVIAVAWSPDGKRIASGSSDKTVQVWDATTGGNVYTYRDHASTVYAVAWSPDGKRIASSGDEDSVQVWQPSFIL